MHTAAKRPVERLGYTAIVLGTLSPLGWGAGQGAEGAVAAIPALLGVAALSGALTPWLMARLPGELDGLAAQRKGTAALMILLGLTTVAITGRLSVYLGDPSRADLSLNPSDAFFTHHSCLTAYVQGARLAREGVDNLYAVERWPHLSDTAEGAANAVPYAPFSLDAYAYPPTFLLLPAALLGAMPDFSSARALWSALLGLTGAAGLWTVSEWIGGRDRVRLLLLAPLVWTSPPFLAMLQAGNVHPIITVAVMVALVAFETRRAALGGALLAFAIVSKISPGLLILLLLLRRRYAAVAWTAAFAGLYAALSAAVFGLGPFWDFLTYELPALSSGRAMTFLAEPESVAINLGPFGVPFRLIGMGVPIADPWAVAHRVSQVFSLALLGLTLLASRAAEGRRPLLIAWAALMTLASMRSPLAPSYTLFALVWGLSVLAVEVRGWRQTAALTLAWLILATPQPGPTPPMLLISTVQLVLVLIVAVAPLLRVARLNDRSIAAAPVRD